MKCKKCGFDIAVFQEFASTDVLAGEWKDSVFHPIGSKDAGYEMTAEYLMCANGHISHEKYEVEW